MADSLDGDGRVIPWCSHKVLHRHGTANAHRVCGCKCTSCMNAAASARSTQRKKQADDFVPAREKTPFGQFQLKPSHLETRIPGQNLLGTWLSTRPVVPPQIARAAALVVLNHIPDDAEALLLLDTLGIKELAR